MSVTAEKPSPIYSVRRRSLTRKLFQYKAVYAVVAVVFVYFSIFTFYPLVLGIIQSFQKVKLIGAPAFVGTENYRALARDPIFWMSLRNSVVVGSVSLFINLAVSLVLAVAINEVSKGFLKSSVQTVTFLPYLFSWTVVGGMWLQILAPNGMVNMALTALGFGRLPFFTSPAWGRPVILFTNAWKQAGYFVVLYLAGIVSIDPAVYEAARIDGASRAKQIRYIIVPQTWPTVKTLLVLGATGVLRNFDQVLLMNRPATKDSIRSILLYIYEEGIKNFKIGTATSAATVVLVITFVLTFVVRRVSKYEQDAAY